MSSQAGEATSKADEFQSAATLIRSSDWRGGLAAFERGRAGGEHAPDGMLLLLVAIARIRAGAEPVSALTPELVAGGKVQDVRRLLLNPLVQEGKLEQAVHVLGSMIEAVPDAREERVHRSSLNARLGRWDEAIADLDAVAAGEGPADLDVDIKRLQYRIRAGRPAEAATIARGMDLAGADERTVNLMLLALIHAKDHAAAAELAAKVDADDVRDANLAGSIVQSFYWAKRHGEAMAAGETFVRHGVDGPVLRSFLARAWQEGGPAGQRSVKAIEHLEAGLRHAPDDLRMVSLLGDLLLAAGKAETALPYLRRAVEMEPHMAQVRARYARALKQTGAFDEAARNFVAIVDEVPGAPARWHRYAAGALSLAGQREQAADMYDRWVASRAGALPDDFAAGLQALWDRVDEAAIPQARLDWAWGLRSPEWDIDRGEWERRAKWGHLADHYLLDWIECRPDRIEAAMRHFSEELDRAEAFVAECRQRAPGNGAIFASAHVGAMYFGPLALELVGERSRWIASTPGAARVAYAESLISTNDQTEMQVALAFKRALSQNSIVGIVVDGAINVAAPRIEFEGQEITYSPFAARSAYRAHAPSAFVAPVWRADGTIDFIAEHLPMAEQDESIDSFSVRWRDAYLSHLRRLLGGPPENLRLSGGLWRHIR